MATFGLVKGCSHSTFHPATPGSSPKQTIYAFSIYKVQIVYLSRELECEKNKNKQKGPVLSHF